MKVLDILHRADACIAKLPARTISRTTEQSYRKTFARMWREPVLDALVPGISLDTYYGRRAALHWVSRRLLEDFRAKCNAAADRRDIAQVQHCAGILKRTLERIEPALERDPPLAEGQEALKSPASRWRAAPGPHPKRGAHSKKHDLALLPSGWDQQLWDTALELWNEPAEQRELDALAVALTRPVRPEEFMPAERPHGWSAGVIVEYRSPHRLEITVAHAKSHRGKYGCVITTVIIDPMEAQGPAAYLAARCAAADGRMIVSIRSKNASRKKLGCLGQTALPGCKVTITPNVVRDQVIADFKATLGAGAEVAAASGQCTDRTQSKYGYVVHGHKRRGLGGIRCARAPRTGNVARAYELAAGKRVAAAKAELRKVSTK